jgi:hypothetical protein
MSSGPRKVMRGKMRSDLMSSVPPLSNEEKMRSDLMSSGPRSVMRKTNVSINFSYEPWPKKDHYLSLHILNNRFSPSIDST